MVREQMMNRRDFLKIAAMASTVALFPNTAFASREIPSAKSISLYNIHTGEKLETTFWADGAYIPEAISDLNHLLRDYRNDSATQMNTALFDLLHTIRTSMGSNEPFQIISGYRSPETNAMLRNQSNGVAKHSLHMEGKAIDINLPGRNLADLRKIAMGLGRGGVGYYPNSNFVHVDVGRVRHW
ncbi:DUF882 domain-containing protein [Sulfuricurvum sp.]|uniref:DUF882 domain-containing protein n=1 Tax=Sulfuricurvum sp. TaxID=2025608 RepID=UPI002D3938AF|nr:DUF882 domain-containing protein [Sulfuricurvum sp.]HZF71122.1 DUF882 domain-containing protein [Sulfuricurvum sp.]